MTYYNSYGQPDPTGYYNEAGEPMMTAEQARFEAALDEQSAYERYYDPDYQDAEQERFDCFMEEQYERQMEGECPACGAYECDRTMYFHGSERNPILRHGR